jgi:hypothetical protein
MHGDAWGAHGGPATNGAPGVTQMRGDVRSYQVTSEVQGAAGYNI